MSNDTVEMQRSVSGGTNRLLADPISVVSRTAGNDFDELLSKLKGAHVVTLARKLLETPENHRPVESLARIS